MTVRHDRVLIVDIEATCWENHKVPEGQHSEIIEVGLCLLDLATLDLRDKRSLLVTPEVSQLSPFCTQLTTITTAMLAEHGTSFAQACAQMEHDYGSRGLLWGSWGAYDRKMFKEQCNRTGVTYPFSSHHFNIKRLFADKMIGDRPVNMNAAMTRIGLEPEGTLHRGDDDAWNIGRLLKAVIAQHGVTVLARYW